MAIPGLNSKVLDRIIEELGLQSTVEKLPTELVPTIQPVLISNPKRTIDIVRSSTRSTTGSSTLFTTPTKSSKRRFFLTNAVLSGMADATADNVGYNIEVQLASGEVKNILVLGKLTTTAFTGTQEIVLNTPLELAPNSDIKLASGFTAGTSISSGIICGYLVEKL